MPLAKIYVHEGRYDEARLIKLGDAIQTALEETLGIPPEDYFRIYQVLPSNRYVHTPGFLGLTYTDDLIMLEVTFIAGRSGDARLTLPQSHQRTCRLRGGHFARRSCDHGLRDRRRKHLVRPW